MDTLLGIYIYSYSQWHVTFAEIDCTVGLKSFALSEGTRIYDDFVLSGGMMTKIYRWQQF